MASKAAATAAAASPAPRSGGAAAPLAFLALAVAVLSLALAVAVGGGAGFGWPSGGPPQYPPRALLLRDLRQLPPDEQSSLRRLARAGQPALLSARKRVGAKWKSVRHALRGVLDELPLRGVRVATEHALFVAAGAKPGGIPALRGRYSTADSRNMTLGQLRQLGEAAGGARQTFSQASAPSGLLPALEDALRELGGPGVHRTVSKLRAAYGEPLQAEYAPTPALGPLSALTFNDTREATALGLPVFGGSAVLWASTNGTRANLHYDRSHSLYVMLEGSKRFRIMAPDAAAAARLYPWLSPMYQQSQAHEAPPDAPFVEVTLSVGDVLLVPAYFLHATESLGFAVAVSVISPSREEMLWSDAYWKLRPFSQKWPRRERVVAVRAFLDMLLAEAYGSGAESARAFIKRTLVDGRYADAALRASASVAASAHATECHADLSISDDEQLSGFAKFIEKAAPSLGALPPDVRETSLINLAEEMLRFAVGNLDVASHVEACY